jgi:hypothetical protein
MAADEGRGATLTLGTSTWDSTALITSITPDAITRAALDTTHLTTTNYRTFIPEDLADPGGFTIEFHHDGDAEPPFLNVPETITITYPLQSGWSTGAQIQASGFCTEYTPGAASVGELLKGTAKFKFTGTITWTDHT